MRKYRLEQTNFLILKNNNGEVRLLKESVYSAFNLKPGMKVNSVIRSRGCAGQEITELLHPVYRNGESYLFTIISFSGISLNDDIMQVVTMLGSDGILYKTRVSNRYVLIEGEKIVCKLIDQNKGRLNFSFEKLRL